MYFNIPHVSTSQRCFIPLVSALVLSLICGTTARFFYQASVYRPVVAAVGRRRARLNRRRFDQ